MTDLFRKNILSILFLQAFLFSGENLFAQNLLPETEGILHRHTLVNDEDSLSSPEIIELRNKDGIPLWFARDIYKAVCLTGECRMIRLRLYWNGVGDYYGMKTPEEEPLTKTDHTVFTDWDYRRLERILSEPESILKNLKPEELIIEKKDKKDQVDATTGATQPSLKDYLVPNAAYTCHTLWHTVYGNTRESILKMIEQRADAAYLQKIFDRDNTAYHLWALHHIKKHTEHQSFFSGRIINLVKSKDESLSREALDYFNEKLLSDPAIREGLVNALPDISYGSKFELLIRLSSVKNIEDSVILELLKQFEEQKINESLLSYVYKLINPVNIEDKNIREKLEKNLNHENPYVRLITGKLLQQK